MARATANVDDRFWRFVNPCPNTGCFLWGGGLYTAGYGSFMLPTPKGWRSHYAHRVAWELVNGPIPPGAHVLHKCDVRWCVNVDHLFPGTNAENVADMIAKRRHSYGERHTSAKLTEAQAREILTASGTQVEIAARFGVSRGAVSDLRRGTKWKHVAGPRGKSKRGGGIKLNLALAREIRSASGTQTVIAANYGVSRATVGLVRAGLIWKEV